VEERHVVVEDIAVLLQPLCPRPDDVEVLGLVVALDIDVRPPVGYADCTPQLLKRT
jgi:hypothetical protein